MKFLPYVLFLAWSFLPLPALGASDTATMYGSDAGHTGVFDDGGRRPDGKLRWKASTGGTSQVVAQPVIADNTVYLAGYDWKAYAFDATTGARLWTSALLNDTGSWARLRSVAILGDRLVTSGDRVYALQRATGERTWTNTDMPLDDPYDGFPGKPTIAGGLIVLADEGSLGRTLGVIDGSGTTQWVKYATQWYQWGDYTNPFTAPVVDNGQIYVMAAENGIYKVDLAGAGSFTPLAATSVCTELSYAAGKLYTACKSAGRCGVHAFSAESLEPVWTTLYDTTSSCNPNPVALAYGKVFAGANLTEIVAFDAQTGEKLWTVSLSDAAWSLQGMRFAYANGVLYIVAEDKHLYAVNASDGTLRWSYYDGTTLSSPPTVANGTVYVAGYTLGQQADSMLLAIGTASGGKTSALPAVPTLLLGQ